MDVIIVLALMDKSLVQMTPVAALIKEICIMKETHSLAKMDATPVLAPLDKSRLLRITLVDALIKAVIIMKVILSLAKMDATVAIVLLDRSLVQIIRVIR